MGRAGASNLPKLQSGGEVVGIVGGGLELSGQTERSGLAGAEEVHGEAAREGEVQGGIAQSEGARVFARGYVQAACRWFSILQWERTCMKDAATVGGKGTDHVALACSTRPATFRVDSMLATDATFGQRALRPSKPSQSSSPAARQRRVPPRASPLPRVSCNDTTHRHPLPRPPEIREHTRFLGCLQPFLIIRCPQTSIDAPALIT